MKCILKQASRKNKNEKKIEHDIQINFDFFCVVYNKITYFALI